MDLPKSSNERLFRKVTSMSIHSFVEWLDTFSYVLRPADVTVVGDLRHHLKKRGYNDKFVESGFSKASEINRNDLLEYKEKRSTNGFSLFSLTIPL